MGLKCFPILLFQVLPKTRGQIEEERGKREEEVGKQVAMGEGRAGAGIPREERRGLVKEEEQSQREGSIFLIDLEETKCNDGKTQLKPKSKKFSASSLLSSKITQSWFFRK